jgi:hypothetical protein
MSTTRNVQWSAIRRTAWCVPSIYPIEEQGLQRPEDEDIFGFE